MLLERRQGEVTGSGGEADEAVGQVWHLGRWESTGGKALWAGRGSPRGVLSLLDTQSGPSFYFMRLCLFRAVLDSQQNWVEGTEISHIILPAPDTCIASPMINIPTRVVHLLQFMHLHWHIFISQSPQSLQVHSWLEYILWVWTNVQWHVDIFIISYRVFSLP